jgi:FkbM family methyltransferase
VPVEVAGRKFRTPVIYGSNSDLSEPWMIELQKGLMSRKKGVFLDVGMNLGQTLLVVKAIEPARPYVGFEPNPQCFAYCEQLVQLNRLTNVTLVPVGLSSSNHIACLQLYSRSGTDSTASVVEDFRPTQPVTSIKSVALFSFADVSKALSIGEIGIIKIDVEGAEWDVLQSMELALGTARPWIVIEILPCYNSENTKRIARQKSIEAMLDRLDYRIMRIGKDPAGRLQRLEPIEAIGIHGEVPLSDYVFYPRQDFNELIAAVGASGA